MSDTAIVIPSELVEALEALAEGETPAWPTGDDRMSVALRRIISNQLERATERLDSVVDFTAFSNEVAVASASILISSDKIGQAAQSVSATSEELSASAVLVDKEVSTSRERMSGIRAKAVASRTDLKGVIEASLETTEAMQSAVSNADALTKAFADIFRVVKTIDSIAMQTNLLALNASVEAARAGDAGRGFSVVATEVRALSEKTKTATADIREMVETLNSEVSAIHTAVSNGENTSVEGRKHLEVLDEVINGLVDEIGAVDDRLSNIATTVSEQTDAIGLLAKSASDSSEYADENVARVKSSYEAVDKLVSMAGNQLAEVAQTDVPNKVARLAKADHVIWKKRLADMFAGRLNLREEELADHHHCRLGKWYYGPDAEEFRSCQAFRDLEDPHARVHAAGIEAAAAYNAGRMDEALAHLNSVEEASMDVIHLLSVLVEEQQEKSSRAA